MNSRKIRVSEISSVIVDERLEITLEEICIACHVEQDAILALVDEGIVEPRVRNEQPWRFRGDTLPRVARAFRLQRDLELNTAGVAFALDLLSEIDGLRKRLKRLNPEGGKYMNDTIKPE